jgi:hypothetical protein
MSRKRKAVILTAVLVILGGSIASTLLKRHKKTSISLKGAVIKRDADPKKEQPIAGVQVTAAGGLSIGECKSDSSGLFDLNLSSEVAQDTIVTLEFRHSEYLPLDLNEIAGDRLYVARMVPIPEKVRNEPSRPEAVVANVSARYSIKARTAVNIGSRVEVFQVVNTGQIPCNGQQPCSPDGKWKAALGFAFLDAGERNEFQNARVSCIAGPCPFTRIETDGFSRGGRTISVSARNWSDTATFLLEAELFHPMVADNIRKSYPVTFGRSLNFTLPASAEGVSVQAEISGETIVFPLGPNLFLSWANCNERVNNDQTKVYRCELKSGYRF